jgi:hypothetical protein
LTGQLFSVDVKNTGEFSAPVPLFDLSPSATSMNPNLLVYEVDQSGQRFLLIQRKTAGTPRFEVLANWSPEKK